MAEAYDTLYQATALKAAGFERKQAEAIATACGSAASAQMEHLAAKSDLAELKSELKSDIVDSEARLKGDVAHLRTEVFERMHRQTILIIGAVTGLLGLGLTAMRLLGAASGDAGS